MQKYALILTHNKHSNKINSRSVVPIMWYTYTWGCAADRLEVRENNIGNGEKYKKEVKIKTQKAKL
jgi:hypothetical protein